MPTTTFHSIHEYIKAKNKYKETLCRISKEGVYWLVDDVWVGDSEFPMPVYVPRPKENSDGTALIPDTITRKSL